MQFRMIASAVAALLAVVAPVRPQVSRPVSRPVAESRPAVDVERETVRLGSTFAAERRAAAAALIDGRCDEACMIRCLASENAQLRIGAAEVLGGIASPAGAQALRAALDAEKDRAVVERLCMGLFRAAVRNGALTTGIVASLPVERSVAQAAARTFVHEEIERAWMQGTEWSFHRRLARFSWLGAYGLDALTEYLKDREVPDDRHCLALIALGRADAAAFWVDADGAPSALFRDTFKSAGVYARSALFYAAAAGGIFTKGLMVEAARIAREDAFDPSLIEAILYFLYQAPDAALDRARPEMTACAREFTKGYSEKVLFSAGILLGRLKDRELALERVPDLKESRRFGSYTLFEGILAALDAAGDEAAKAAIKDILVWALGQKLDTLKARAYVDWAKRYGAAPEEIDRKAMVAALARTVVKQHAVEEDEDNYAARTGADVFHLLGDPEKVEVWRKLFDHSSEAVRAAALISAGREPTLALAADVLPFLARDGEWDNFGATYFFAQARDRRALPVMIELLDGGNILLQKPTLENIHWVLGGTTPKADEYPKSPAAWRALAARLRAEHPTSMPADAATSGPVR